MANLSHDGLRALLEKLSIDDLCQKREVPVEMDSDGGTADRTESTAALDELSEREEPQGGRRPDRRAAGGGGCFRAGLPLIQLRRGPDAREAEEAFDDDRTPVRRAPPAPPPLLPTCGAAGVVVPTSVPLVFATGVLATASCSLGAGPPAAVAADLGLPAPAGAWAAGAPLAPPPPIESAHPWLGAALGLWPAPCPAGRDAAFPPEALPSVGSALHAQGLCKPCAFVHTKGCESGSQCQFCHLCDEGEKNRRKKEKAMMRKDAHRARPRIQVQ